MPTIPREQWLTEAQIKAVIAASDGSEVIAKLTAFHPPTAELRFRAREDAAKAFRAAFGLEAEDLYLKPDGDPVIYHDIFGWRGPAKGPCLTRSMSLVTGKTQTFKHVCAVID